MKIGGEMEGWRAQLRAKALLGVGRTEEAVDGGGMGGRESRANAGCAGRCRSRCWRWAGAARGRRRTASGTALEEALEVAEETNAVTCVLEIEAERERARLRPPASALALALELGDHQLGVQGRDQVLQRLGAGFEHLHHPLGRHLAGEPFITTSTSWRTSSSSAAL